MSERKNEMPDEKPKLKWEEVQYGGMRVSLAGGFVTASAFYASVGRNDPKGYQWRCNGFESKRDRLYPSLEAAQLGAENFIARRLRIAIGEIAGTR
jgi:hypothetical protein